MSIEKRLEQDEYLEDIQAHARRLEYAQIELDVLIMEAKAEAGVTWEEAYKACRAGAREANE